MVEYSPEKNKELDLPLDFGCHDIIKVVEEYSELLSTPNLFSTVIYKSRFGIFVFKRRKIKRFMSKIFVLENAIRQYKNN